LASQIYRDTTTLDTTRPTAKAGADQNVNEDLPITLDGSFSSDDVGVAFFTWTFEDVTTRTLTGERPDYVFNTPGVYTLTLSVVDEAGNRAADTVAITVLDVTRPEAIAGPDLKADMSQTVNFDAGASSDNVGVDSYSWDFGDGTTGTGRTTTHTYANAGNYTVTLTVEDAAGNLAADRMTVTVSASSGIPNWMIGATIAAVGACTAIIILKRRKTS
jgi:PKD repeat protein